MDRLEAWLDRLTVMEKVFVANGLILAAGGVGGFWLADRLSRWGDWALYPKTLFVVAGISVMLGVDYTLLAIAFQPLRRLRSVMGEIHRGRLEARVGDIRGDRLARELAGSFNRVLDRLEGYRRSVSSRVLRALEDERRRIARELHDETSQSLTSLLIQLDLLEQGLASGASPEERIRQMRRIAEQTLQEVHRLTFELRPTILDDLGLEHALRWYVNNQILPAGLECQLTMQGLNGRLPEAVETACFRIVQEALTNVVRHAGAQRVEVSVRRADGRVRIEVRDDGRGFTPEERSPAVADEGFGLAGMRERAALAGGHLVVESAPGRGTTVRADIPLPEDRAA